MKSNAPFPEYVFFWVDPEWEGIWVKGIPSSSNEMLFDVNYTMTPTGPASRLLVESMVQPTTASIKLSSVKVQFFNYVLETRKKGYFQNEVYSNREKRQESRAAEREGTTSISAEKTQQFRFASAFPLSILFSDDGGLSTDNMYEYGLWNENQSECDGMNIQLLNNFKMIVTNAAPHTIIPVGKEGEEEISFSSNLPSIETHRHVLKISQWIKNVLNQLYPEERTGFKDFRTFLRNPWSDTFFFDLHKLFEHEPTQGTNLPSLLAPYVLCNAIMVQCLTPHAVFDLLSLSQSNTTKLKNKEDLMLFLQIMRDVLMCFTLCAKEGKYIEDECMHEIVEDQPFLFSMRNMNHAKSTNLFFEEDDCEGRNQQGCIHMRQLFCSIAVYHRHYDTDSDMPSLQDLIQSCEGHNLLLAISTESMQYLISICIAIGEMFLDGTLKAFMAVGDCAVLRSHLDQTYSEQEVKDREGHSFGLLLYKQEAPSLQGAMIMETTCYECKDGSQKTTLLTTQSRPQESYAASLMQSLFRSLPHIVLRIPLTPQFEDALFVKVFAGNDTIFFSQIEDKKTKQLSVQFGARPLLLDKKLMHYDGTQSISEVKEWGECAISVSPMIFLEELATGRNILWNRIDGADEIYQLYQDLYAKYPFFHRCFMPPQVKEATLLDIMQRKWGAITEDDIQNAHGKKGDVIFSIPLHYHSSKELDAVLTKLYSPSSSSHYIIQQKHPFMQSILYNVSCT